MISEGSTRWGIALYWSCLVVMGWVGVVQLGGEMFLGVLRYDGKHCLKGV